MGTFGKIIVVCGCIFVAFAVFGLVLGGMAVSESEKDKGTYTAEIFEKNKIPGGYAGIAPDTPGFKFLVASITLTNTDYSGGISLTPYRWEVQCDGISYGASFFTYMMASEATFADKTVEIGGTDKSYYVFEVPKDWNMSKCTVNWIGYPKLSGTTVAVDPLL